MLSICAVLVARNEADYLKVLLPLLASQNIDVAIIDNESTDNSVSLYTQLSPDPVIMIEFLPYRGFVSLWDQLEARRKIYTTLKHDWLILHSPDEVLEHRLRGRSLRDAIEEADAEGYNGLNFDEFVFLPEPEQDLRGKDYCSDILRYYFFEPYKNRLNRAWKNGLGFEDQSGGHRLSGGQLRISPISHVLRHYIVLGYEHALAKYLNRKFDEVDLKLGWHDNRRNFTRANLTIPAKNEFLQCLGSSDSKSFCKDHPSGKHYWEWPDE